PEQSEQRAGAESQDGRRARVDRSTGERCRDRFTRNDLLPHRTTDLARALPHRSETAVATSTVSSTGTDIARSAALPFLRSPWRTRAPSQEAAAAAVSPFDRVIAAAPSA